MKIIGIDCGTAITGWCVLEVVAKQKTPTLLGAGIIQTHKLTPEPDRLLDLGQSIADLLDEFKPDEMSIEDIFFFKNATTVIKVSQARGVTVYEARKRGIAVFSYTPLQIKQQLTGYGRADKKQMLEAINETFSLNGKLKQDDTADAIAAAYCHFLNKRLK
jgi:crossover junction endodeoxyribonuclease RuvC